MPRLRLRRVAGRHLHRLDAGVRGREPRRTGTSRSATPSRARRASGSTTACTTRTSAQSLLFLQDVAGARARRRRCTARGGRHPARADHPPRAEHGRRAAQPQRRGDAPVHTRAAAPPARRRAAERPDETRRDRGVHGRQRLLLPAALDGGRRRRRRTAARGIEGSQRRDRHDVLVPGVRDPGQRPGRRAGSAAGRPRSRRSCSRAHGRGHRVHGRREHHQRDGRARRLRAGGRVPAAGLPGRRPRADDRQHAADVRDHRRRAPRVPDSRARLPRHADRHRRPSRGGDGHRRR